MCLPPKIYATFPSLAAACAARGVGALPYKSKKRADPDKMQFVSLLCYTTKQ